MARRSAKKTKLDDVEGQPDPKTPLDWQLFLSAAQPVLKLLQDDLRARAKTSSSVGEAMKARHAAEKEQKRTADSFVAWQDQFIAQVAAAWVLSCVFVRTLEDRGLLGHNRIAGPGAADSLKLFLELAPSLNERDYLLTIFRELTRFPSTTGLFDARHNPVWLLAPSAEGAKALVQLFQQPRADVPAFRFGQSDTAFLGWLYQDLDADVRERFALLQTPRFIESFILDRTLEPAIEKFGLDDTTLIDPTCGSGHFLLGAFERLFNHRLRKEPGLNQREAARRALDAVYGADINPYAVAIARFRLTLAFFDKAGFTHLAEAPVLPLHVVVGDSLLHNPHVAQGEFGDLIGASAVVWKGQEFALEDEDEARAVLHRKFAAVVGNPPYITVKDAALRERYRALYPRSAAGKYSIAAPFTERFFQLGRDGGRVGLITANSFMKREFGKKLIEQYLPTVNLDLVINTSGTYIPGHGTPTVLMFGSTEQARGGVVQTVLASRGEPVTPSNAEQGLVWRSIADNWSEAGFENEFISVATTERASLAKHPWSLGGGGAAELKELLEERCEDTLIDVAESIGISSFTLEDDVFLRPSQSWNRTGVAGDRLRSMVIGEVVRDWAIAEALVSFWPYSPDFQPIEASDPSLRSMWQWRTTLSNNKLFAGKTKIEGGLRWYEYGRLTSDKLRTPLTIVFAEVATHNHFVLDSGGKVFKQTAPIIKLSEAATEDEHLVLLAYLNSSTTCFWMKQVSQPKGNHTDERPESGKPEMNRYQFASTALGPLPLPRWPPDLRRRLVPLSRQMLNDASAKMTGRLSAPEIAQRIAAGDSSEPARSYGERTTANERLSRGQRVLDALVYAAFGLIKVPVDVDDERLLELVASDGGRDIALLETDTNRRLWKGTRGSFGHMIRTDAELVEDAAAEWVLDQLELRARANTTAVPRRDLASVLAADGAFNRVREHLRDAGDAIACINQVLTRDCAVPFLAALRFTESGLDRFVEWEETWALQRREDAGEKIAHIPVPPKYGQGDYVDGANFRLRGALDVPKERFISYPGCESDQDGEPVYGWAGWDHEQRAKALATLYWKRKTEESWGKDRLTPMLAGLLELLPWLKQWHGAVSDDYAGDSPANYYAGFLDGECRAHGLTHDDLRAWRPAAKVRGKKAAAKTAATMVSGDDVHGADPAAKPARRKRTKKDVVVLEGNETP